MATHYSTKNIAKSNLVYEFDRDNPKQYFGKPTTNLAYTQNRYKGPDRTEYGKGYPPGTYTNYSTYAFDSSYFTQTTSTFYYNVLAYDGTGVLSLRTDTNPDYFTFTTLSTPYNVSTWSNNASVYATGNHTKPFRYDKSKIHCLGTAPAYITQLNLGTTGDLSTLDTANPIRLKMPSNDMMQKAGYPPLAAPYDNWADIDLISYNRDRASPYGFSDDGKKFYVAYPQDPMSPYTTDSWLNVFIVYNLTTPFDFQTAKVGSVSRIGTGIGSGGPYSMRGICHDGSFWIEGGWSGSTDYLKLHRIQTLCNEDGVASVITENGVDLNGQLFSGAYYEGIVYNTYADGKGRFCATDGGRMKTITGSTPLGLYSTAAAFENNHPDCIIGTYVNSGVNSGNWSVTHHAYWKYDEELKQPVVIMNDNDGQWKAKSWGTGYSFDTMGLVAGQTYSISWLQWTTNTAKAANVGLYMRNSSGTWGFHAGMSQSQSTAWNTKPYTWQRCYATFTVPANMNMSNANNIYMYGHYNMRGVVKIADVQFETGDASLFTGYNRDGSTISSRSVFHMDPVSGNTTTPYNLVWQGDGSFRFNGSSSYATSAAPITGNGDSTVIVWCKPYSSGMPTNTSYTGLVTWGSRSTTTPSGTRALSLNTSASTWYVSSAFWGNDYVPNNANVSVVKDQWNMVGMIARGNATSNNVTLMSGNANGFNTITGSSSNASRTLNTTSGSLSLGCLDLPGRYFSGEIALVQIYDRELTAEEYEYIFKTTKARFGL